jgi:hypothetical protein
VFVPVPVKSSFAGLASDTSVAGPASGSIVDEHTQVRDPGMLLREPDILVHVCKCHLAVRQMNSGGNSFELVNNLVVSDREDCALASFGELDVPAAPVSHNFRATTQGEGSGVANYETSGASRGYDISKRGILIE